MVHGFRLAILSLSGDLNEPIGNVTRLADRGAHGRPLGGHDAAARLLAAGHAVDALRRRPGAGSGRPDAAATTTSTTATSTAWSPDGWAAAAAAAAGRAQDRVHPPQVGVAGAALAGRFGARGAARVRAPEAADAGAVAALQRRRQDAAPDRLSASDDRPEEPARRPQPAVRHRPAEPPCQLNPATWQRRAIRFKDGRVHWSKLTSL